MMDSFIVKHLGQVNYDFAYQEMLKIRDLRLKNEVTDHLLVLEHLPVITTGRKKVSEDLLVDQSFLKDQGIQFQQTDRGGKLTYHGPGQIVIYFIFNIFERKWSIQDLVCKAEQGLIDLLKTYQLDAKRDPNHPGIWIENSKIASLGFHVHRGITTHGICLNINPDLKVFDYFIPCGIRERKVTSMVNELGRDIDKDEVIEKLVSCYGGVF